MACVSLPRERDELELPALVRIVTPGGGESKELTFACHVEESTKLASLATPEKLVDRQRVADTRVEPFQPAHHAAQGGRSEVDGRASDWRRRGGGSYRQAPRRAAPK